MLTTSRGPITLRLRPDVAPVTAAHFAELVRLRAFDNTSFYRSDFVIQCGLHGTERQSPLPDLRVNESKAPGALSNTRGTVAMAHWDVPDNGNSECFIK